MLGEEFGWRAYLLPKLMQLGARKTVLLVGAIWAVWHWPFVVMVYEYGIGYWGAPWPQAAAREVSERTRHEVGRRGRRDAAG